jgi:probable phosphoglycerate mutase
MKQLYFVRHGESEDNAAGIWSRPATPLTARGREQALATARKIEKEDLHFDLIISSALPRAQESAKIIAAEIGYPVDQIYIDELFIERGFGELTGTSGTDFFADGKTRAHIDHAPGAELLISLQKRAADGLAYMQSRAEERILLVGHGTLGRALGRVINNESHTNEYLPEIVRYKNAEIVHLI